MTDQSYRDAFERAKADLAEALSTKEMAASAAEKAHLESIRLRRAVTALAAILGEDIEDSMGLTEAVRAVFHGTTTWRTLSGIKQSVEALGASLVHLKNQDASVLSVLSRLVASGELETGTSKQKAGGIMTDVKIWRTAPEAPVEPDDDIPF